MENSSRKLEHSLLHRIVNELTTESIWKLSNFNFRWTKTLYQNICKQTNSTNSGRVSDQPGLPVPKARFI